jgi:2-C-methyl-D-erythritol 2,4-cyclodiphosphate synthase
MRVGQGYDVHRLVAGRELWLGGVRVPHDRGLAGHSDGDVLLHAVTDALLGALGVGDLGSAFGSDDPALAGADSAALLERVLTQVHDAGWRVSQCDATVIAEEPRLAPHQPEMRKRLAELLDVTSSDANVKVTSTDGLGPIGRGEGIAAQAIVLLVRAEGITA